MKTSIIIPVYNQLKLTIDCLSDLLLTAGEKEIIVVDDCSTQSISTIIPRLFPDVKLLRNDTNLGFARTVNKGIVAAGGDIICLLNNDIRLPNIQWLKLMIASLQEFDITSPAGGRFDSNYNYLPGEAKTRKEEFAFLVGWCLVMRRDVVNKIGLISESFGRGFWEDVEYSYRAKKAGLKLGITEGTQIKHLYHATFKAEGVDLAKEYQEKRRIFLNLIGRA